MIIFLAIVSYPLLITATNYQEVFFKANELYKEGKYQQAQALYQTIPNPGPHVHYNLGNCAFKLGRPGYALVHWRRAEKNWGLFNRAELLHNIALVKKQHKKQPQEQDSPLERIKGTMDDFKSTLISFVRSTPLFMLQFLFLIMWIISFLYLRYLYRRRQKAIIVLLFAANLFCGMLLIIRYNFEYREHGIVVTKQAELMSGPGKNYQLLSTLPETTQVLIKGASDGFYKVYLRGTIGWINKTAIETY
jgi:tetratricopeptide (TPR) repeat protein